jgi:hypothetical protein
MGTVWTMAVAVSTFKGGGAGGAALWHPASNKSAKGADARRKTRKKLRKPLGGELDTATGLRAFVKRQRLAPGS